MTTLATTDSQTSVAQASDVAQESHDRHFATDHLLADLKGRSVRGGAVTLAAQGIKFALQMGSTMVLARLLTPADFGLIAMVVVVTGFAAMFKDAGLSMATVQREHITHEQVSTLFWINVALSVLIMLLVAALAPVIARFYGEPQLTWITLALASTFIFGGLTVQHQALLQRQMRFKALAVIEILSLTAGIATAITMALLGFGYWSLVGLPAGTVTVNCLLVWIISDWRPGPPVRASGVRPMLGFGGGLTGFNVLNYFTRNADNLIIGFALGAGPLGVYSKAYYLLMMPIRQFSGPVGSVMIPALSRLQTDPVRYRRAFLGAIGALASIGMPLVAFLFVVADEAVTIVLGEGWEEAAPVFRWLAPAALLGTVNVAPGWLCISLGRPRIQVIWAMISAPVTVAAFLIGVQWGLAGIALAFSISWCSMFVVFLIMACHRSPLSFAGLAAYLVGPILAAVGAAAITLVLVRGALAVELSIAFDVLVNGIVFIAAYVALTLASPSGRGRIRDLLTHGLASLKIIQTDVAA